MLYLQYKGKEKVTLARHLSLTTGSVILALIVANGVLSMCGIFGAVNSTGQWKQGNIRALAWANRERGTDSMGFFDSSGKVRKKAGDPKEMLAQASFTKWLTHSEQTAWFVAGHTRFATRGSVCRRNSHPFRYGRIVGSHNGCVDAPNKFQVDSEYLFWALNKNQGDYNKALGSVSGYWGLAWYDGEYFYLCQHNGELHVCQVDGVWYYSSDDDHLAACTGGIPYKLKEGEVWRFDSAGNVVKSTDEDSPVAKLEVHATYVGYNYGGSYYNGRGRRWTSSSATGSTGSAATWWDKDKSSSTAEAGARDYDAEWMEAWSSYCSDNPVDDEYAATHNSIHSMSDDDFNEKYAG